MRNTTNYDYDNQGNLIKETLANNTSIQKQYDAVGKVISQTDALNQSETFGYDADENLISNTDRNGVTTKYEYNNRNFLAKKSANKVYSDNYISPGIDIEYTYDNAGNIIGVSNGNMNNPLVGKANTTKYTYYDDDSLKSVTTPDNKIIKYQYDNNGNRTLMVDYFGKATAYTYDSMNRMKTVTADNDITTYYYYPDGRKKSTIYPNNTREDFTYDGNGNLLTLRNAKTSGSLISQFTYEYDKEGNQISKVDSNGETFYNYDSLGRIKNVVAPPNAVTIYYYDAVGNRTSMTQRQSITTYAYDANNRLTAEYKTTNGISQRINYTYDKNGNQLTKSINGARPDTYTYDEFDRLVKAVVNGQTNQYDYNADGLRISKTVGGVTTKQYWDGTNIVNEADQNGNLKNTYIRGTSLIGVIDASGSKKKYLFNGHGDVVGLSDANGNVTKSYDYDIFGNEKNIDPKDTNPFRYAGEYYDNETGDYYLRARYYNPADGRFISEDTYEGDDKDPLSLNWYTYCEDDPVNGVDPSGHMPFHSFAVSYSRTIGCGIGVNFAEGVAIDDNGNIMAFTTPGFSATMPVLGKGIAFTLSTAKNVNELKGWGVSAGGSASVFSAEVQIGKSSVGISGGGKTYTTLIPLLLEVHGTLSYTYGATLTKSEMKRTLQVVKNVLKYGKKALNKKTILMLQKAEKTLNRKINSHQKKVKNKK